MLLIIDFENRNNNTLLYVLSTNDEDYFHCFYPLGLREFGNKMT